MIEITIVLVDLLLEKLLFVLIKAMDIPDPSHIGEKHPQNEGVSAPLTNGAFCYWL